MPTTAITGDFQRRKKRSKINHEINLLDQITDSHAPALAHYYMYTRFYDIDYFMGEISFANFIYTYICACE